LFNVEFENATAKKGGGFFTSSSVRCMFCTFCQSKAQLGGGFAAISATPANISIANSHFVDLKGESSAAFYFAGNGSLNVLATNFSRTTSELSVGAFESSGVGLRMMFSLFHKTTAGVQNGGIVLKTLHHINISQTLFHQCGHRSDDDLAGAALFVKDVGPKSQITDSLFVQSQRKGGHSVSFENGGPLLISNCCFTGTRAEEVFTKDAEIDARHCQFSAVCNFLNLTWSADIGFSRKRSPTYTPATIRPIDDRLQVLKEKQLPLAWKVVIISGAFLGTFAIEWVVGKVAGILWGMRKTRRDFE
jgi:hypothetical protein